MVVDTIFCPDLVSCFESRVQVPFPFLIQFSEQNMCIFFALFLILKNVQRGATVDTVFCPSLVSCFGSRVQVPFLFLVQFLSSRSFAIRVVFSCLYYCIIILYVFVMIILCYVFYILYYIMLYYALLDHEIGRASCRERVCT